jgi:hypothetical protein
LFHIPLGVKLRDLFAGNSHPVKCTSKEIGSEINIEGSLERLSRA